MDRFGSWDYPEHGTRDRVVHQSTHASGEELLPCDSMSQIRPNPDLTRARTPLPAPSEMSSVSAGHEVPEYYVNKLKRAKVLPWDPDEEDFEHEFLLDRFTKAEYEREKGRPEWKNNRSLPAATVALENLSNVHVVKGYTEQSLHGELEVLLRVSIDLTEGEEVR